LFSGFAAKSMATSASRADASLFVVLADAVSCVGRRAERSADQDFRTSPSSATIAASVRGGAVQHAPGDGCGGGAVPYLIGVAPGWLYQFLPYQDFAMAYLEFRTLGRRCMSIQQFQLLVFAALAFMLLQWRKYYCEEQAGLILDVEWIWRRGGPDAWAALVKPFRRAGRALGSSVADRGKRHRRPAAGVSQVTVGWQARFRQGASAIWSLGNTGAGAGRRAVRLSLSLQKTPAESREIPRYLHRHGTSSISCSMTCNDKLDLFFRVAN